MKNFYKLMLVFVIAAVSYVVVSPKADAVNKNDYISKVYPITDAMNTLKLDVTTKYQNMDSLTVKIGKKEYSFGYSDLWLDLNGKVQTIEFAKNFTAGNTVLVYANYSSYDANNVEVKKSVLVDTLKVTDKTAPAVKTSALNVRTKALTLTTEKNATLSATYNGKKLTLKKKNATTYTTTIAKPILGKKLVVKATDKAKNSKTYTTATTVPTNVKLTVNKNVISSTKKITGKIAGSTNTDVAYFTVASKTYKAKVKSGKFTISFPATVKTPSTGKVVVKDKNNNVLASANVSVYKYASLKLGMTPAQAANTPEGKPAEIDKETYDGDKLETWTYYIGDKVKIVTFFNNKLDYISK